MPKRNLAAQLDAALEKLLEHPLQPFTATEPDIASLVHLGSELLELPREEFRMKLKSRLLRAAVLQSEAPSATVGAAPVLQVRGADQLIDFLKQAFLAVEEYVYREPNGALAYARLKIGDMALEMGEAHGEFGPRPGAFHLYVPDTDAAFRRALHYGAASLYEPRDMPYGDREGGVVDPSGNHWYIGARKQEAKPTSPLREEFHTITPYLIVEHAEELVEFVKEAFGATELLRAKGSAGGLHAELRIGDSMIMIGGAPGMQRPASLGTIYLYVPDVDAVYERALRAGATSVLAPADQPYGDRNAHVVDPFGNTWFIATPKKSPNMRVQ